MVLSVNASDGVFSALRNLTQPTSYLGKASDAVTSGFKAESDMADAAIFSISHLQNGEVLGLNSVKNSLDRAISITDVASAAGEAIATLLDELKDKAISSQDTGLDDASRDALNADFIQIRDQITNLVNKASFAGINIIDASDQSISAITDTTGEGVITVPPQDLSLGGPNVILSDSQTIDTIDAAESAFEAIEASIDNVSRALTELEEGASSFAEARDFADILSNTTEVGIESFVDSNIGSAQANQIAGEIRQQLGFQSLSIVNGAKHSILSLFR